jgi:hypothetical protein
MPVDPRRAGGGSAEIRGAQRIADLERRLGQLERGSKGAVLATGVVSQTSLQTLPSLPTHSAVVGLSVSLTAQVPTIVVVSFNGTGIIRATPTINAEMDIQLYQNGTTFSATNTAYFRLAPFAPATSDIITSITLQNTWRVSLGTGTSTLAIYGGADGLSRDLSRSTMTYIQTRA